MSISQMGAAKILVVHSRLTVVPSKPTPAGKVHELPLLDHTMQRHFVRSIYYFNSTTAKDGNQMIEDLKESLCRTLSSYPVYAGRLRRKEDGKWEVKCNDAGVRVYEANAHLSLDDWLTTSNHPAESELATTEIIPNHAISPVAIAQFTVFKCGGLAIGFSWLHILGDPSCGALFMKAWGETHRAAQILHPPFYRASILKIRPDLNMKTKSAAYYAANFCSKRSDTDFDSAAESYETVSFKFTHDAVQQCISEVEEGCHRYEPVNPFDVISALFWAAIVKVNGKSNSADTELSIGLEFRKIQNPPLPHGYVGNAQIFTGISSSVNDLINKDLSYASRLVNEAVTSIDTAEIESVICWLEQQERQGNGLCSKPTLFYGPDLTCCAFENFFCYDVAFDLGKPIHISYFVQPLAGEGLILILPGPDGNLSRTVVVTLPKDQIRQLCEDLSLLKYTSDFRKQSWLWGHFSIAEESG
eukprot:c29540_g1_i1 orf=331-1746(+)